MASTTVSYRSSAFHSKMSDSNKVDTESRDLRSQCDQLRKELERKDLRNQKTSKEMQQVRSSFADLQVLHTHSFIIKYATINYISVVFVSCIVQLTERIAHDHFHY